MDKVESIITIASNPLACNDLCLFLLKIFWFNYLNLRILCADPTYVSC